MASQASKLHDLELFLKNQHGRQVGYWKALREAILAMDPCMEVEVLKSLGDLHLQKGKLKKDSAEFDKAAALYAAALLRCTDPDMGETLAHRIGYMEKLSRQLLQGYTPQYQWLSSDNCGNDLNSNNVLRVAKICAKLDKRVRISWSSFEEIYTETLVAAVDTGDVLLELEVLKSLGDFYLEKCKRTSDVSQFSKTAAMYNKALMRCEEPEIKQTLRHRILYMVNIWGEVTSLRNTPANKSRPRGRGPSNELRKSITISDSTQHNLDSSVRSSHQSLEREYKDHLKEGESSLVKDDLDSAEQHFSAALKTVHARDSTAQLYQREVEPLCKLADVYSKRGQQTGDGGDFVKAAALYNAAIARSEDKDLNCRIAAAVREIENLFPKYILNTNGGVIHEDTDKHKKQLKEMRDQIKLEMETIDQQLVPYVHDEEDPCVKEIEAKRAQAVRQLFEKIAEQRKEFINQLVEECIALMGPPTCQYALIGLGSQATELVTPYSDLEFAILVEEEREDCLMYFRNLTHYLHLKVVNLGETILPALGIKSLNDFYSGNPLDDWYFDSVTPRGFAFDGSMPKASKTPLGRQGSSNEAPCELICTPESMVEMLQKDTLLYRKEGYHLATILRNPCLIAGEKDLIDKYIGFTVKLLQADGGIMSQQLVHETLKENVKSHDDEKIFTARMIDVKKAIYRFPAIAVDCLALFSCIIPTTVWKTIEEMENQQVISPSNAHHLMVLTSISAELRLRTYIANGGQRESLSPLTSMEKLLQRRESSSETNWELQANPLSPVFHLPNENQLYRYYYTAVPLKTALSQWSGKKTVLHSFRTFPDFYDSSPIAQGTMHLELCKYRQAISYYTEALGKADRSNNETARLALLHNIGYCCIRLGDYRKAISFVEEALHVCMGMCDNSPERPVLLGTLGKSWGILGDKKKAICYIEQALQLFRSIYGQNTLHPDIADSLNYLGRIWADLGYHKRAISNHEQSLQMYRSIYGQNTTHDGIVRCLSDLGATWHKVGHYRKGVRYLEMALMMIIGLYGHNTVHPDIAGVLNNLGQAWIELNDDGKAINYIEQALQMYMVIYGHSAEHPVIAFTFDNLGVVWSKTGNHRRAVSYFEQALQMHKTIYGQNTDHEDIAKSLRSLGAAWHDLGDDRKAIRYFEQALKMGRSIYGQSRARPLIATLLTGLGSAWYSLNDFKNAIWYNEHAFQMQKRIYGQSTVHPCIAALLKILGMSWSLLGDNRKALSYFEQELQMNVSIYGRNAAHPNIAMALCSLGINWHALGDHERAVSFYRELLALARRVSAQDKDQIYSLKANLAKIIGVSDAEHYA